MFPHVAEQPHDHGHHQRGERQLARRRGERRNAREPRLRPWCRQAVAGRCQHHSENAERLRAEVAKAAALENEDTSAKAQSKGNGLASGNAFKPCHRHEDGGEHRRRCIDDGGKPSPALMWCCPRKSRGEGNDVVHDRQRHRRQSMSSGRLAACPARAGAPE